MLVSYNQTIQVYDPTLTTNRGSCNVTAVDPFASTITADAVPAGTTANDVIVHDDLTGAQPVSLFGLLYHQSNATTGTWLNLNRATYPVELATPRVNGNNSTLTPGAVRLAINKVHKALGTNQVSKLIAYTSLEQEHQVGTARRHNPRKSSRKVQADAPAISICSSPAKNRWPAFRLNLRSTPTSRAWISSTSRTGDAP